MQTVVIREDRYCESPLRRPSAARAHRRDPQPRGIAFGLRHSQNEIARLVGIDPKTLRFHYADQIELGTIKATAKVAQNLFTMACKPTREGLSAAIFWLKVRAGWSEYAPKRPAEAPLGKKEAAERDALTAGEGNEWGQLVN